MSIQDALKLWSYTEPYFDKLEKFDCDQMESCEELLTQLADVIPPPPDHFLASLGPDRLLYGGNDGLNILSEVHSNQDHSELDELPCRCGSDMRLLA